MQACIKIKKPRAMCQVVVRVGNIMYDKVGPFGIGIITWAMGKLRSLTFKYLTTNAFWDYMEAYYLLNSYVWWLGTKFCHMLGKILMQQLKGIVKH
jgi:hypothetical protein